MNNSRMNVFVSEFEELRFIEKTFLRDVVSGVKKTSYLKIRFL